MEGEVEGNAVGAYRIKMIVRRDIKTWSGLRAYISTATSGAMTGSVARFSQSTFAAAS